jgi:hypothetical protein
VAAEINFVPKEGEPVFNKPPAADAPLPPNTFTMDLVMPNVTIPTAKTSYLCTHFKLPDDKKYHIIAQEVCLLSCLEIGRVGMYIA